jgi:RHS repeat-associated protein
MGGISDRALKGYYTENKHRFVGQLYDDDLGWDTYQFKFRTQDPQLGRFWQVDPLATKYVYNSTYAIAENRVVNGIDLEGAEYFRPSPSEATAIAHAANPTVITSEKVKVAEKTDQISGEINAKAAPVFAIGIIGFAQPEIGIPLAVSYLTGAPATPSPQAMATTTAAEGMTVLDQIPATVEVPEVTAASVAKALEGSTMQTTQPSVSLPVVQDYVEQLAKGRVAPAIKVDGNVIVDGNHRYIAGRVFGTEPATTPGTMAPSLAPLKKPIQEIKLDNIDWGNR